MAQRATKADVESFLEAAEQREADLRKEVVRVARLAAARHNWCDVAENLLRKLGLQEEMGLRYYASYKSDRMQKWGRTVRGYSSASAVRRTQTWKDFADYDRRVVAIDGYGNETVVGEIVPAS